MGKFQLTPKLQGDMGELMFEHYCQKNNYAYITLEEIYRSIKLDNKIIFRSGYDRIPIILPIEIVAEIRDFCIPSNGDELSPSFVFDYLTMSLNYFFTDSGEYRRRYHLTSKAFNWVEVKTGKSELTPNQKEHIKKSKMYCCIFRINTDFPKQIDIDYNPFAKGEVK